MSRNRPFLALFAAAAAVACPAALVRAQDLPSPAGAPPQSTVIKGKAPVDDKVLRVKLPRPKEYTLPNGARLFVLEDRKLPTVSLTVSLRAGDLFESKRGVASLAASLLTEGTKGRPYAALNEEVERLGANLGASAGSERASVSVSGLSSDTDALVNLLADVVLNPAYAPERLQQAQFRSAAALAQQRTNPEFLAGEYTRRLLYGAQSPYGRPSVTAEQIQAITPQDLSAYHATLYRPEGARIAVAGDVKADEIAAKLRAAFAGWQKAEGSVAPELPKADAKPIEESAIYLIDRPGSAQTVLTFGNLAISRNDPDYVPLVVANFILGGNFNSRLNQKLREEKGFTYGASSGLQAPKWVGTWTADAAVRTEVTADATRAFLDEFNRFQKDPVSGEELERAKRAIVGSFALTLESPSAVLDRYLTTVEYGLPADYWDTFPRRVEAVSAADVRRVAQKYLGEGRVQLVAVGERSAIEPTLSKIGPVTVVPPSELGIAAPTSPPTPAPATGTGSATGAEARGELVSARKVLSVGKEQVAGLLKPYGLTPQFGMDWYEVVYRTVDAAGKPTVASGGLLLPAGVPAGTSVPLLSYQHGTLVEKAKAPSAPGVGEASAVGALFAAGSGYAVAAADYIGLGKSTVALHPYLVAESEAAACVDMLRATKVAAKQSGVGLSDRLFLAGYSQGGHATMALHRALERDHAGEFKVTASAPMAGPYYLSGVTTSGALTTPAPGGRTSYYAAYLVLAYQSVYGDIYTKPSDVFRAPYDAKILSLFDGTKTQTDILKEMPASPAELLTEAFVQDVTQRQDHPFRKALQKNDLYDWKPAAPVRLYGGGADRDVPFANSEAAAAKMKANGAAFVEAVNVGADKDHGSAFFPSLLAAREWFASFK